MNRSGYFEFVFEQWGQMFMRHISFCAALGVVALVGSASFAAQSYVSPDLRYTNLPVTQVADIGGVADSGIVKCSYASPDPCGGCSTCADCSSCAAGCASDCGYDCGCGCGMLGTGAGWIAGYEFLWLKPHFSSGINYESAEVHLNGYSVEQGYGFTTDYYMAPRVWFGYQFCSGFAARLRYWQFDNGFDSHAFQGTAENSYYAPSEFSDFTASNGDLLAIENGLKADVIDFDLTQDFNWCHTRLTLGGGISYAGLRMDRGLALASPGSQVFRAESFTSRFEGIGPSVVAELKRQIRESGFSVVGGVRGTVLFGRESYKIETAVISGEGHQTWDYGFSANRCRAIVTASIGVQYDREILNGTDAFVRLSWEGQYWNGVGNPVDTVGDLAFEGLGIAAGIRR